MLKKHILVALAAVIFNIFTLSATPSFAKEFEAVGIGCNKQQAEIFSIWHTVRFNGFLTTKEVVVRNLNNRIVTEHLMMGPIVRLENGNYVVHNVSYLIDRAPSRELNDSYSMAIQEIVREENGIAWLKEKISEDIRTWATQTDVDNISHSGDDVPSLPFGRRTVSYRLPNETLIYLSPESHRKLVDRWSLYRPGNM